MGAQLATLFSQQDHMFVRPDERLLGKFFNARIERSFVGKAMLYARSRTRNPDLSATPQPIKYKVPILLITDKRMIFLARPDQLLSRKMGTISSSYYRSKSTSFIHLYLSPFWVFPNHSPFSAQLQQEFNEYMAQLVDHSSQLRKDQPLKWWGSILAGGLGLQRTGTPMSDREEVPGVWTEFAPGTIGAVQTTTFFHRPFLEFKLDRVVASPRSSVAPGPEGTAKLFLEHDALAKILELVRNTSTVPQPHPTTPPTPGPIYQPGISIDQQRQGREPSFPQPGAVAGTGGWQRSPTNASSFRWRIGITWWMLVPAVFGLYLLAALAKAVGASWLADVFGSLAALGLVAFFILGMFVQFLKIMRRRN